MSYELLRFRWSWHTSFQNKDGGFSWADSLQLSKNKSVLPWSLILDAPGLGLLEKPWVAVGAFPPWYQVPLCHHHRRQCPQSGDSETGEICQYFISRMKYPNILITLCNVWMSVIFYLISSVVCPIIDIVVVNKVFISSGNCGALCKIGTRNPK